MGRRHRGPTTNVCRTQFDLMYEGVLYSVQADVHCTWTAYQRQTHTSPEEPVTLSESELETLIEVLIDATGEEPIRTVGLLAAISEACTDTDLVGAELSPPEEDERRSEDD